MANAVQPPEGLRKLLVEALDRGGCEHFRDINMYIACPDCLADAVLAALFDACEIDVQLTSRTPDGGWILPAGDWPGSLKATHRQLVITTPPESASTQS
jgi:hypothetical protein